MHLTIRSCAAHEKGLSNPGTPTASVINMLLSYFCPMTWQLILGLTIPSVVVLVAIYLMFKQYFQHQLQSGALNARKERTPITLPLRLQAFERLIMLCERIDLAELVLRLKTPGTNAGALKAALILAIQQEYEHNVSQQLYVSDELWNILQVAKNKTMDMIMLAGEGLDVNASADEYAHKLIALAAEESSLPSQIAKRAVKTEAGLWI
jgi:hypothetical protein